MNVNSVVYKVHKVLIIKVMKILLHTSLDFRRDILHLHKERGHKETRLKTKFGKIFYQKKYCDKECLQLKRSGTLFYDNFSFVAQAVHFITIHFFIELQQKMIYYEDHRHYIRL